MFRIKINECIIKYNMESRDATFNFCYLYFRSIFFLCFCVLLCFFFYYLMYRRFSCRLNFLLIFLVQIQNIPNRWSLISYDIILWIMYNQYVPSDKTSYCLKSYYSFCIMYCIIFSNTDGIIANQLPFKLSDRSFVCLNY